HVKRIKPALFAPYDLSRENHTRLLWDLAPAANQGSGSGTGQASGQGGLLAPVTGLVGGLLGRR
ncbi:hypothetical protein IMZ29_15305, partial [Achromobacter sp. GG226]